MPFNVAARRPISSSGPLMLIRSFRFWTVILLAAFVISMTGLNAFLARNHPAQPATATEATKPKMKRYVILR